ncbi:TAP42-like protein [Podospora conica]|nr:TAP42-like protein [Schizothecium conicum]
MDDNPPSSLSDLFATAESSRLLLESSTLPPSSPSYTTAVDAALAAYTSCSTAIASLALFSPNESLDDLPTSSLPYLLTPHHLGDLTLRLPAPSLAERKNLLTAARAHYERFLHDLDSYALLSPAHAKLLERYTSDPLAFSVAGTSDPAGRRDAKIANFRAEKEMRAKLDFLRRRPEYGADGRGGDEDAVRAVHLANLEFHAHQAFQALEGLGREWDVLKQAPPEQPGPGRPADGAEEDARRRQRGRVEDGYSERLDMPLRAGQGGGPLLSKEGKPLQPFTLVGSRQELAKGVFRPGHNLPTMSIDEYLEEERRRGGIIEGGGEASGIRPEPDEDDYEKGDAETMKARAWDEYVEANPKGSGNTLNRG